MLAFRIIVLSFAFLFAVVSGLAIHALATVDWRGRDDEFAGFIVGAVGFGWVAAVSTWAAFTIE